MIRLVREHAETQPAARSAMRVALLGSPAEALAHKRDSELKEMLLALGGGAGGGEERQKQSIYALHGETSSGRGD